MRRQRREMVLKARAQLQSLAAAGEFVVKGSSSASGRGGAERRPTLTAAAALQDPQLRRQLLNKLRQHDVSGCVTTACNRNAAACKKLTTGFTSFLEKRVTAQETLDLISVVIQIDIKLCKF